MNTVAVRQGSPEWLAARRATIGSSDIPVIVGESSYKSARTLAAEKLGLVPEDIDAETRELMDIGTLLQPSLLRVYERITGRKTKASRGWLVHPQIEWATASLDGTAPVRRVVEAKWSNAVRWRSGEKVPGDVEAQVQWQMFVSGWDVADVIALSSGIPRVETVERNDSMIDNCLYFAREFHGYLERGELPPPDGSDSTRRTWQRMYPEDNGVWVEPTADLVEMVRQLAQARADKADAEKRDDTIGNALRTILGPAAGIAGMLSARQNKDTTRIQWPGVAKAYRSLLARSTELGCEHVAEAMKEYAVADLDTVESLHTDTSPGSRPLRLLKGAKEE
jgi:putative phage-type endonuclease